MEITDIAIIGTGPAGVSAALNAKIRKKTFYLFGSKKLSWKIEKSPQILNYPGLPAVSGEELNQHLNQQMEEMKIPVTEGHISLVYKMKDYFSVLVDNQEYRARTVILATGVEAVKPIPGELELTGRGVSYCATCDGGLYRGKTLAVVCDSQEMEHEVEFLAGVGGKVYYWPLMKDPSTLGKEQEGMENIHLQKEKIKEILGEDKVSGVVLADGSKLEVDGVFFIKQSLSPAVIMNNLEMRDGHVVVDRNMMTSVEGCYAAGDCTGRPYQLAKAVGEGNVALHSILEYLKNT